MDEVADRYVRRVETFARAAATVPDTGWGAPTPCGDWTVRDLVAHVAEMNLIHFGRVGVTPRPVPSLAEDPSGAWHAIREQVQAALADVDVAGARVGGRLGDWTYTQVVDRAIGMELVVHQWDLARALGWRARIDPADVDHLWHTIELVGEEEVRFGFGPAVPPPDDADAQARLLAYLGRHDDGRRGAPLRGAA
ncbi:TIGR03086 family protein [Micromonospora sp. ALFpr18c]|uniref:TIGR03086 family metal-binding protein n=1 Tax=Micromonospora sp. ALFpr18c TaxID=1458665 RepID=UPI00124AF6AB|nr:TIGR03086 family metal-binding protein [Micromonospora sp. ALFpr18c]KAB1947292.1 TIGR03086 family protein [Micromonospora sp. ALFpr18c]